MLLIKLIPLTATGYDSADLPMKGWRPRVCRDFLCRASLVARNVALFSVNFAHRCTMSFVGSLWIAFFSALAAGRFFVLRLRLILRGGDIEAGL